MFKKRTLGDLRDQVAALERIYLCAIVGARLSCALMSGHPNFAHSFRKLVAIATSVQKKVRLFICSQMSTAPENLVKISLVHPGMISLKGDH